MIAVWVHLLLAAAVMQQALPDADRVLRNVERTMEGVEDFTATIEGEVSMEGVRIPRTTIRMFYKRPGLVHFESESFGIIPREGMLPDPADLRTKYDAMTVGVSDSAGERLIKLQLAAKDPKTRLRQAYVWVDASNWTLRRLDASPYANRIISFQFEYIRIDGRHWLPSVSHAMFGNVGPQAEPLFRVPEGVPNPAPQFEEMQRTPRSGFVVFRYKDHRVNVGLPDSIFTRSR